MGVLSNSSLLVWTAGLLLYCPLAASDAPLQRNSTAAERDASSSATTAENPGSDAAQANNSGPDRTELNLLGQTDSSAGESRRNENVRITLVDNAVQRELNERLGASATIIKVFKAETSYFGAEIGSSPSAPLHQAHAATSGVHGRIYETHNNSVFSAR